MRKNTKIDIFSTLIMIMLLYTGFSKFFGWSAFVQAMAYQPFSPGFVHFIVIVLPPIEILTALMLMFDKFQLAGLVISTIMMLVFTCYVGLIISGFFAHEPCPCGGALSELTWKMHFVFNIFFLVISVVGTLLKLIHNKKRHRMPPKIFHARNQVGVDPEEKST